MSEMFKLKSNDFVKGAITALITGLVWSIGSAFNQTGFDIFSTDWGAIIGSAINAGIASGMGYLIKNLGTDSDGKFLGSI